MDFLFASLRQPVDHWYHWWTTTGRPTTGRPTTGGPTTGGLESTSLSSRIWVSLHPKEAPVGPQVRRKRVSGPRVSCDERKRRAPQRHHAEQCDERMCGRARSPAGGDNVGREIGWQLLFVGLLWFIMVCLPTGVITEKHVHGIHSAAALRRSILVHVTRI